MMSNEQQIKYKILTTRNKGWFTRKINFGELEMELNRLGIEGWDLVTSFDTNYSEDGGTKEVVLLLKKYIQ